MAAEALAGLGLVLLLAAGGRWWVHRGLAPERVPNRRSPGDLGLTFESASLPTANGRRLSAWFIPAARRGPSPAVAVLHGWGGNAETMLPLARPLFEAGFAQLYFDARCHGHSDDDSFASLPRFAEDLEAALDWLARRPEVDGRRLFAIGHSVGAGATLLTASRRRDLAGVVSLAAFAHPENMMRRWLRGKGIPHVPIGWLLLRYVERAIGHRFDDIAPIHTIGGVPCPVLLVHGSADATVPVEEARQIHAAGVDGRVRLRVIPGGHDQFGDAEAVARETDSVAAFLTAIASEPKLEAGNCCAAAKASL